LRATLNNPLKGRELATKSARPLVGRFCFRPGERQGDGERTMDKTSDQGVPVGNAEPVYRARTAAVRGGLKRSGFNETSEALYLTSGFVYGSAAEAETAFAKPTPGRFVYSRFANPTVAMFEERLRQIEGAEACRATATGMAAVFAALMSLLRAGDRIVASRALFGSCHVICAEILPRYGVTSEFVDGSDKEGWKRALTRCSKSSTCLSSSSLPTRPARRSWSTTCSPRRCCNDRWRWARTWWCTRLPSISTARDAAWAARSWRGAN
jgi:hypothetical protein